MTSETRQRLLDAAVELLLAEGSPGVTTVRLTERAGVVQSAFYNHFASVAECRAAALYEVERQILALSSAVDVEVSVAGTTLIEDIERMLLGVFRQAEERPALFAMLTHRRLEPEVDALIELVTASVADDIRRAILAEDSRLRAMQAEVAELSAGLVVGVVFAALDRVLAGADPALVAHVSGELISGGIFGVAGVEP